jgi:hypothetical protein
VFLSDDNSTGIRGFFKKIIAPCRPCSGVWKKAVPDCLDACEKKLHIRLPEGGTIAS